MELEVLQQLIETPGKLVEKIIGSKRYDDSETKMYDIKNHDVLNNAENKRPDRYLANKTVYVTRIPLPLQELVVSQRAAFLCSNPVELSCNPANKNEEDMLVILKKIWDDNKMDYEVKRIAERMMSECEVAGIWYSEPAEKGYWKGTANESIEKPYRFRLLVVSPALGDSLYPVFNRRKDLIAFGRGYKVTNDEGKDVEQFDLYTKDFTYFYQNSDQGWVAREEQGYDGIMYKKAPNPAGKIQLFYLSQPRPEWFNVQWIANQWEKSLSDHGDINGYFVGPAVVLEGEVESMPDKNDNGKIFKLKNGAKVYYLTWDHSPASLELEQKNLRSAFFDFSQTVDISIEQMKSVGADSSKALKLIFMNAHLAVRRKEGEFGPGIQRCINYLLAAVAKLNPKLEAAASMVVKPKFTPFLPTNEADLMQLITESTANGTMSKETGTMLNPLIEDGAAEWEKIKAEQETAASDPAGLDALMGDKS